MIKTVAYKWLLTCNTFDIQIKGEGAPMQSNLFQWRILLLCSQKNSPNTNSLPRVKVDWFSVYAYVIFFYSRLTEKKTK